ncbi:hypothetical protein AB205_0171230 [Aquarana catesbeiana]|uniref:Uncharacterized protein n=1 Tax=Aquarana catesbeiana TaxID=8400 RepID=A0A2G9NBA2_AQUCT|nr:hypothetical protein AB205_0171230 [Aquarana catesbeiana]
MAQRMCDGTPAQSWKISLPEHGSEQYFPRPFSFDAVEEHMAGKEQLHEDSSNDESLEPRTWRFKASNMSFVEMVEMLDILKRADYDGKHGPYPNPNVRKAKIMIKVVKREKGFGTSEDTRDPQPPKEGEIPTRQPEDVEEGEVYEFGKIVTTTGDVDVVEEETHFTSASAHVLIGEIMMCNRDLGDDQGRYQ